MVTLPLLFPAIPFDTAKAAWSIYERDNFYLATGDQANQLFYGVLPAGPERQYGKPVHTIAMLYLITIFQYLERISDSQAEEAAKERINWKYALHLPLNYPGMAASSLCEFRRWLVIERTARNRLQLLLGRLSEVENCPSRLVPVPAASQIISEVCQTSRLARTWEALSQAMKALATKRPGWLVSAGLPHWYEHYSNPQRILHLGADRLEQHAMIQQIGAAGFHLLKVVSESRAPGQANLPAIYNLKQIWREQFEQIDGRVLWRSEACAGCSLYRLSPLSMVNSNLEFHI